MTASVLLSVHVPDHRHTDKDLRLVMTLIALCCIRQSRAPKNRLLHAQNLILTYDLDPWPWPDLWPWHWTNITVMSKHDFWHLTLTFDLRPGIEARMYSFEEICVEVGLQNKWLYCRELTPLTPFTPDMHERSERCQGFELPTGG